MKMPHALVITPFLLFVVFFNTQISAQHAKRGDIKLVEIMYNPPEAGTDTLEYLEFYNTTNTDFNLGGYTLFGVSLTIPNNVVIPAKGRVVFSGDSTRHRRFFGNHSIKWKSGSLTNSGEVIGLRTPAGVWVDSLRYGASGAWPKEPNGHGPSLVLCNEMLDNKIPANWAASTEEVGIVNGKMVKGTPGKACFKQEEIKDTLSAQLLGFEIISATRMLLVFSKPVDESARNLSNYSGLPSITSATITPGFDSVFINLSSALQRGKYYYLNIKTIKDLAGNLLKNESIEIVFNDFKDALRITEILRHETADGAYQFIEFYNATTNTVSLGGLKLQSANIESTLPDVKIAPGSYYVVAKDSANFRKTFGIAAWQWNSGSLQSTNDIIQVFNTFDEEIAAVNFGADASWPVFSQLQEISSITLCDALLQNNSGRNWQLSTENSNQNTSRINIFASPGNACAGADLPVKSLGKNRSICGSLILDAKNPGAKYKWQNGTATQTLTVIKQGTYSVIIVNGAGAVNDTISLYNLQPEAYFDTLVCMNETVTFSDNSANVLSRKWVVGKQEISDEADAEFIFKDTGFVNVKLVISDSFCSDSLTKKVYVKNCKTNVKDFINTSQSTTFDVFPNPAQGKINLKLAMKNPQQAEVLITDLNGKKVAGVSGFKTQIIEEKFDLQYLPKGVYLIHLKTAEEVLVKKLVLN